MPNTLISAITPLHPTTAQAVQLSALFETANAVHLAVRHWLRAVGSGSPLSSQEAFSRIAADRPLPAVDDRCPVDLPASLVALLGSVRSSDLPGPWRRSVPPTVLDTLLRIEGSRLARFGVRSVAGEAFPLRPLDRMALDAAACPLDAHHVTLGGVDQPIIADLWALPSDLTLSLRQQAHDHLRTLQQQWTDLHSWLRCGQPFSAPEALQLAMQTGVSRDCPAAVTVDAAKPARARHVSLVPGTDVSGGPIWQLEWSIRIPQGYLPGASVDDTVGIDLGYRRLGMAASAAGTWFIERHINVHEGLPLACRDNPLELLAHARTRRLLLDVHRAEIEAFVLRALTYRRVHIEEINWSGFQTRGNAPWSAVAMDLIGTPRIAEWIRLFAPLTSSRVRLINPAATSTTCHRCGGPGSRPRPFTVFDCPVCGSFDADVNSAYVIRRG